MVVMLFFVFTCSSCDFRGIGSAMNNNLSCKSFFKPIQNQSSLCKILTTGIFLIPIMSCNTSNASNSSYVDIVSPMDNVIAKTSSTYKNKKQDFEIFPENFTEKNTMPISIYDNDLESIYQRYFKLLGESSFMILFSKHLKRSSKKILPQLKVLKTPMYIDKNNSKVDKKLFHNKVSNRLQFGRSLLSPPPPLATEPPTTQPTVQPTTEPTTEPTVQVGDIPTLVPEIIPPIPTVPSSVKRGYYTLLTIIGIIACFCACCSCTCYYCSSRYSREMAYDLSSDSEDTVVELDDEQNTIALTQTITVQ